MRSWYKYMLLNWREVRMGGISVEILFSVLQVSGEELEELMQWFYSIKFQLPWLCVARGQKQIHVFSPGFGECLRFHHLTHKRHLVWLKLDSCKTNKTREINNSDYKKEFPELTKTWLCNRPKRSFEKEFQKIQWNRSKNLAHQWSCTLTEAKGEEYFLSAF